MTVMGITTTVPQEVLLAAGCAPVDLNNIFISDAQPERLVGLAERAGFPMNCCTWIKGIYGVCMERGIENVLCVTTGDCSNTVMLMEVLKLRGVNAISFAYPDSPNTGQMQRCLDSLATALGTTIPAAEGIRLSMMGARHIAKQLDDLTWKNNVISGWENHYWLVTTSDFGGDYERYRQQVSQLLEEASGRRQYPADMLRIAYIGVPAIFARSMYNFFEEQGARVVFNEVQRQFSMPGCAGSLAKQYTNYTYPYSLSKRLQYILPELERRRVDGVIHYVQAFCHRGIADIIFRHHIGPPILTLEGNNDYTLTQHVQTRIEAFLDLIKRRNRNIRLDSRR